MNGIEKVDTSLNAANMDLSKKKCDDMFDGVEINISKKDVQATEKLEFNSGVICRLIEETLQDMVNAILLEGKF